jgi:hypothetical protein
LKIFDIDIYFENDVFLKKNLLFGSGDTQSSIGGPLAGPADSWSKVLLLSGKSYIYLERWEVVAYSTV